MCKTLSITLKQAFDFLTALKGRKKAVLHFYFKFITKQLQKSDTSVQRRIFKLRKA